MNDFPRGGAGPRRDPPEPTAAPPVSTAPALGTMATDSWALAVDEQEAAAESVSCHQPLEDHGTSAGQDRGLLERHCLGCSVQGGGAWREWDLAPKLALLTQPLPRCINSIWVIQPSACLPGIRVDNRLHSQPRMAIFM